MDINRILANFAQKELVLSYNDTERDKIKGSLTQLEKVLKAEFGSQIIEFIRFGSFTRNTILPREYDPKSDVDLMVVFNTERNHYSPGTYRTWILDCVSKAYPKSISKKDFPVVKLEFNHIMFDIVPAYSEQGFWSTNKSYYIPDAGSNWRTTHPNDINDDLTDKNQRYGDNVIRNVIRLCKHWNAMAGYPFESYLMEKQIINLIFWGNENTFERFLKTMGNIAGGRPGVAQALENIRKYEGGIWEERNEAKQLQWLQKLLPGLK